MYNLLKIKKGKKKKKKTSTSGHYSMFIYIINDFT